MADMSHWTLFIFLAGLVATWSLILLGVQKHMMSSGFKALEKQIAELSKIKDDCTALERELLELKADLPSSYVRREDFIRFDVVINSKLDKLRDLVVDALRAKKEC
jgi:hypothetical protein